jgi:Skp family chaperone for outer membrane proteins
MLSEGSIIQEEYSKKSLGILLNGEEYGDDLMKIMEKHWNYSYQYVKNHSKIDIDDFVRNFAKKNGGLDKIKDDILNSNIVITLLLSRILQKETIENEGFKFVMNNLAARLEHYKKDCDFRISYNKITKEEKEKMTKLREDIIERYGKLENITNILDNKSEFKDLVDRLSFLFDFEKISFATIFSFVPFKRQDIEEILYIYIIDNDTIDIKKATEWMIYCIFIRYWSKAYKEAKEYHFKNNKEIAYIELEDLQSKHDKLSNESVQKDKIIKDLQNSIQQKDKEIARLKAELNKANKNKNEIISLREFLFSLDNQREYVCDDTIDITKLSKVKGLILGGHEQWQKHMKELLPSFVFLHCDRINFDVRILRNIDIVFIYADYLNHAIYERLTDNMNKDIKPEYLQYNTNEKIVLGQIYDKCKDMI